MLDSRPRYTGASGSEIGARNLERVRKFFAAHIGATNVECARALGLSTCCLTRHVKALRKEWGG